MIVLNGQSRPIPQGQTVLELLAELQIDAQRVAVERNRVIVRRADWPDTTLAAGDQVEVVQFVGGG